MAQRPYWAAFSTGTEIDPMDADNGTPRHLADWCFGPSWPGRRCGARTRRGTACQKAALTGRARCRNHGGVKGGAPSGPKNPNFVHGGYSAAVIAKRRTETRRVRILAEMVRELGIVDDPRAKKRPNLDRVDALERQYLDMD